MKLESDKQQVSIDGNLKTFDFQVKVTAKTFDVLVDKLYSNKQRAVLRELSTNAYEAHQMVGKENVPFLVVLPNYACQNLIIRDYGPGLSPDEIRNIYTVLFESTKSESNNLGGCFGLGSKSPFAYTDSFNITSYKNGKAYYYTVFRNTARIPTVAPLGDENGVDSTEESGVEITIPCKYNDIAIFRAEAADIFKWFKTKPKVVGQSISIDNPVPKIDGTGWGYYNGVSRAYAVMANVAYEIPSAAGFNIQPGIVMFFNIGDVEPEPSRESLSLSDKTKKSINDRYNFIKNEIASKAQASIKKCADYWEFQKVVSEMKMPLLDHTKLVWTDDKGIQHNFKTELRTYISPDPITNSPGRYIIKEQRSLNKFYDITYLYFSENALYICDDEPDNKTGRYRTLINDGKNVYMFSEKDLDLVKKALLLPDRLIKKLSDVDITKVASAQRASTAKTKVVKFVGGNSKYNSHYWESCEIDVKTDSGYYVPTYNNMIVFKNGAGTDKFIAPEVLSSLREYTADSTVVFGFRPQVKPTANWKPYLPFLIDLVKKKLVVDTTFSYEHLYTGWNGYNGCGYVYGNLVTNMKLIGDPKFKSLLDIISLLEKASYGSSKVKSAISSLEIEVPKSTIDLNTIKGELSKFASKYPLLNNYRFSTKDLSEIKCYLSSK